MAFTTTGSVSYDTAAYDLMARFALRPELYYDAWTDVRSTNLTHRGSSVTFWQQSDLAVATTPLTEDVDVTPVAIGNTSVTVTPLEYGNATVTTARLNASSVLELDPLAANVIGYNAGVSIDTIAQTAFATAGTVRYAAGSGTAAASRVAIVAANTLRSYDFRRAYADLSGANVRTFANGLYTALIHPDTAFDLKSETGDLGWRAPQVYGTSQEAIHNGEIGAYEGFRVIVSPRAPVFVDAGATSTVDVYRSLFFGQEAMAKGHFSAAGYGADPVVVRGEVTDLLKRFTPIGWKHAVAYGAFRSAAMRAVESSSSIAVNV